MFGMSFFELIIIAIVALIFVGPQRLPDVMKQAGRLFVHARRTANDVKSTFDQVVRQAEEEIRREEAEAMRALLQPKPVNDPQTVDVAATVAAATPAVAATPAPVASATPAPVSTETAMVEPTNPAAPSGTRPFNAQPSDALAAASTAWASQTEAAAPLQAAAAPTNAPAPAIAADPAASTLSQTNAVEAAAPPAKSPDGDEPVPAPAPKKETT